MTSLASGRLPPPLGSGAVTDESTGFRTLGPPVIPIRAGLRVDAYLSQNYPFLSRAAWQRRIETGQLLRNGRPTKASVRILPGDQLWFWMPPEEEPEVDRGIYEIWRSGGVMAVFKPGGLPMHENGAYRKNTFKELAAAKFGPEWSAIHRLDLETSGIVLCGATPAARCRLAADLEGRRVAKEYLAIVRGRPESHDWTCDGPIGDFKRGAIRIKKWVVPDGLPAQTLFRTVERRRDVSLIEARPLTGRTNQIRVHAAYSGHPLVGDKLYHQDEEVFLEYWEKGVTENVVRRTGFHRCCLHAAALTFRHPETGAEVRVDCALPPDLTRLWDGFGG